MPITFLVLENLEKKLKEVQRTQEEKLTTQIRSVALPACEDDLRMALMDLLPEILRKVRAGMVISRMTRTELHRKTKALEAVAEVHGEPCHLDHHGLCQAHSLRDRDGEPECEMMLVREALSPPAVPTECSHEETEQIADSGPRLKLPIEWCKACGAIRRQVVTHTDYDPAGNTYTLDWSEWRSPGAR